MFVRRPSRISRVTAQALLCKDPRERPDKEQPALFDAAHQSLDLIAAMLATRAPLAKVLTVIPQHVITILAEP
jgi:hypothetical protein